jgi:hypothetical protein
MHWPAHCGGTNDGTLIPRVYRRTSWHISAGALSTKAVEERKARQRSLLSGRDNDGLGLNATYCVLTVRRVQERAQRWQRLVTAHSSMLMVPQYTIRPDYLLVYIADLLHCETYVPAGDAGG